MMSEKTMRRTISIIGITGLWVSVACSGYELIGRSLLPYENGRYFDYVNGTVIEEQSVILLLLVTIALFIVSLLVTTCVIRHKR
jgi:hypothetical protein